MRAVGVKQLKAHLSEYIRLAKTGETVLVTEREEVVAELRPARRRAPSPDDHEEVLEELAEAGEIERPGVSRKGWTWSPKGLGLSRGAGLRVLASVRDER